MKTEEPIQAVSFPCSDGSTVTIPETVAAELEAFDVKRLRVIKAGEKRYYYVKTDYLIFDAHDMPEDVPLWQFVAYSAKLFDVLPGLGQISHDGSDAFLVENFSREAEPKTLGPVSKPRPVKTYTPKISAELIAEQLAWFEEPALYLEAVKWAAHFTNPSVAEDIVNQSSIEILTQIRGGQCEAVTQKKLKDYVLTIVGRHARRATHGLRGSNVLPGTLERKGFVEKFNPATYIEGDNRGNRRVAPMKSLSSYEKSAD